MLINEEGRLTKLLALGRSFQSVFHVLLYLMCFYPCGFDTGAVQSGSAVGCAAAPAVCEPLTEPVGCV